MVCFFNIHLGSDMGCLKIEYPMVSHGPMVNHCVSYDNGHLIFGDELSYH